MRTNSLLATHTSFRKHIKAGLKDYGMKNGQARILYYLSTHEGCQQRDIAENCYLETATLSSVLSNMEKRGLIERRRSDKDRRSYSIYTREAARPLCEAAAIQLEKTMDIAFAGFTEKEKKEMEGYLNRIEKNIRNSKEWKDEYSLKN